MRRLEVELLGLSGHNNLDEEVGLELHIGRGVKQAKAHNSFEVEALLVRHEELVLDALLEVLVHLDVHCL